MDLNLYLLVLKRFKYVVIAGVILATLLAFLSYARLDGSGLRYREPKQWASHVQLLVTQPGCPICQATVEPGVQPPGNLTTNAVLYANLASSPVIERLMLREGKVPGVVEANAESTADGSTLPIIDLAGVSTSKHGAGETASRGVEALREYIREQQIAYDVAPDNRVILSPLGAPEAPRLIKSPSITRPVFIFLAVLIAVIGLAFILENLRPRVRVQPATPESTIEVARSAGTSSSQRRSG